MLEQMRIDPNQIIKVLKANGYAVEKTAADLHLHSSTIYRWVRRARSFRGYLRQTGLKRLSTRPKLIKRALSPKDQSDIMALRKVRGYAAEKIAAILKVGACWRTIHRFLKRRGQIRASGSHRRPRFQETTHMHAKNAPTVGYLQMDVKYVTPELSGLTWTCFEYGVIDIFSRYKEAVISNQLDQDGAMSALLEILPKFPFRPVFIQTDNGLEFQERFHSLCQKLNLKHHYVHKNTPNENALIERSFRTDEEEFFFRLPGKPKHYDELRSWFASYLHEYNYQRPHFGINLKTPSEVVAEVMSD